MLILFPHNLEVLEKFFPGGGKSPEPKSLRENSTEKRVAVNVTEPVGESSDDERIVPAFVVNIPIYGARGVFLKLNLQEFLTLISNYGQTHIFHSFHVVSQRYIPPRY